MPSPRSSPMHLRRSAAAAALAVWLAGSASAHAHEKRIHQQMTEIAFEIMRLADNDPTLLANPIGLPPGVTSADWNAFRTDMIAAGFELRTLAPGFDVQNLSCRVTRNGFEQSIIVAPHQWTELRHVSEPLGDTFPEGRSCGVLDWWFPDGIYAANLPPNINDVDRTGLTLGHFAAAVDLQYNDTHLFAFRPTNSTLPGAPTPLQVVDGAVDNLIMVAILPFVCAWEIIVHGNLACGAAAAEAADDINPLDDGIGLIPGVGDLYGPDYVGFWHHINVAPGHSNDYDDVEGMTIDEGTWDGDLDPAELVIIAVADAAGQSLDYDLSDGPHRYEIGNAGDGHRDSTLRSKSEWQFLNYPHTQMAPLDNLAFWGWRRFRGDDGVQYKRQARWLGWPLHALGDAAAPHHTIGAPGWGHRPFEIAVDNVWDDVRQLNHGASKQRAQAQRIFARALRWRKLILDWRQRDPIARATNLPVRDLVTALARETYDYSVGTMAASNWPFDYWSSAWNKLDSEDLGPYTRIDMADLTRPLIENAIGAKIALLTFATEVP